MHLSSKIEADQPFLSNKVSQVSVSIQYLDRLIVRSWTYQSTEIRVQAQKREDTRYEKESL